MSESRQTGGAEPATPPPMAPSSAELRPAPRHAALPVLAAGVTVTLWASAFVGIRAAGHDFSPGALALGRLLAGAAALTAIVGAHAAWTRRPPRLPRGRVLAGAIAWGAAWFGAYNLVLNQAEQHLDAGTTALLVNTAPALVALFAGLLLGEGFPRRLLIGVALAFGGVALIASGTSSGMGDGAGVALGLIAALLYAASATGQKRLLDHVDALTLTWIGCLAGVVAALPFAPELFRQAAAAPPSATLTMVYLGVFPTAVAFLTWGYALTYVTAGRLAASTYLSPPLVIAISWLALSEAPVPLALAGGVVCLVGVAVATRRRRARAATPAAAAERTGHRAAAPPEPTPARGHE
ncbi:DMT family transporter [Nocardiopsis sp. RSe5-2]|uniref:DMT family transporter n=1 Tax=Nocardiopsis endophytica TaxID=3018445 RepID=A0ABT4TYR0_9ACTN|nr:DMT family transporter [Nocardiopsis endophytica]MDA2809833.1 DMT family transporter [Nocardiopsis endophytica]